MLQSLYPIFFEAAFNPRLYKHVFTSCHLLASAVIQRAATLGASTTLLSTSAAGSSLVPAALFFLLAAAAPRAKDTITITPLLASVPDSFEDAGNMHTKAATVATVATLKTVLPIVAEQEVRDMELRGGGIVAGLLVSLPNCTDSRANRPK